MRSRHFYKSVLDIRKGEWGVTLLLFFNIYLLLLTYYLLKPARDALFLVELGPEQLPFVFIFIALVMIPVTSLYSRASVKFRLNKLIIITLVIMIINLFILRFLMNINHSWISYIFYTWVSIYGALTTSQFWLLANAVYNATEAKRLFAFIGLGGILGAWSGGEITSLVISLFELETENLLVIAASVLVINIVVTSAIYKLKKKDIIAQTKKQKKVSARADSFARLFATIKSSKHLVYIVSIISIAMIVSSLVDFQFKAISTLAFQDSLTGEIDKVGLTSFLGTFYGRLSLASIIIQLFISSRMLRVLGVGGIIMFLPVGLLLGTAGLFAFFGLTSVVLLRGTDGAFKNSIDKTGRELLFLPVPSDIKNQVKVFIDLFIDRWARGVAGGILILLLYLFSYETNPEKAIMQISIIVLVLLIGWIAVCFMVRREYVNTFRLAIQNREIDQSDIRLRINESATINTLIDSLGSTQEREIEYALDMLHSVKNNKLVDPLLSLLSHKSHSIREKTIALLVYQDDRSHKEIIETLINDPDPDVQSDAMFYFSSDPEQETEETIREYIDHPDQHIRLGVLLTLARYGNESHKSRIRKSDFDRLLTEESENKLKALKQVIRIIGLLEKDEFKPYLRQFIREESKELSLEVIKAIGRLRDKEFIPYLIAKLEEKENRFAATKALAGFGEDIIPTLQRYLEHPDNPPGIKKFIPRVLSKIPSQQSIDCLLKSINCLNTSLRYFVIKALNRLHASYPDLIFDKKQIDDVIFYEIKNYYRIYQVLKMVPDENSEGRKLLIKALEEKLDDNLERIFRFMGLRYPSRDIYSAYNRLTGNDRNLRASAIEFLDNLLKGNIKRYLLPLLDEPSYDEIMNISQSLLEIKQFTLNEALLYLIRSNDNWLKALAIYNISPNDSKELIDEVSKLSDDSDQLIIETARHKLKQLASQSL